MSKEMTSNTRLDEILGQLQMFDREYSKNVEAILVDRAYIPKLKQAIKALISAEVNKAVAKEQQRIAYQLDKISDDLHEKAFDWAKGVELKRGQDE